MYHPFKKIRIAVIGARSSGKSFLLYDIIHAFSLLGFKPEELPLSYPHSSFGAFFYDNLNSETGGMLKTDGLCRPQNHYGAYLSGNLLPTDLPVDFLNIPGEVFDNHEGRIEIFYQMREMIEDRDEDMFYLSEWRSPSGRTAKLIVPKGFSTDYRRRETPLLYNKRKSFMAWENILDELDKGRFKEKKRKRVSGKYIFQHITELNTDSVIHTLKDCWSQLKSPGDYDWADIEGKQVDIYFYPLAYCDLATDIVLCDKLTDDIVMRELEDKVCFYFDRNDRVTPHIYLSFRAADVIIQQKESWHQEYVRLMRKVNKVSVQHRNDVYTLFLNHLLQSIKEEDRQLEDMIEHIEDCVGDAFWNLLNYAYMKNLWQRHFSNKKSMVEIRNSNRRLLPPHVYFTATPIDARFAIYENDEDVTRFYHEDGYRRKSFTREVLADMSQHQCFGSLQLLTDILIQNDIPLFLHGSLGCRSEILKYFQYKF
jgi:hypothetical protein